MAQANISLLSTTTINSYSSQDSIYTWDNLLDGDIYTNGRSASANPTNQWIIIDLDSIWPLVGFKLWNATFSSDTADVRTYKIEVSSTGTDDGDFIEVVPETHIFSIDQRILDGPAEFGSSTRAIPVTDARYVRLWLLSNNGNSLYIAASDFEIYSLTIDQITTQVQSDATIFLPTNTETIISDAFVHHPVYTDRIDMASNAEIAINRFDILSDARIVNDYIFSDAYIIKPETITISSDAYIYRSKSFVTDTLLFGTANLVSKSHNALVFCTDLSSSDEVIVNDMVTGPIMDMQTVAPPLGYNNYDWKYDWVVRTFNSCQYKFEVRSADEILALSAQPFREITLGEQIYKGQVDRYHQWRCHIWASGSGDFELHQFTIKGYVDHPANPLYRTLYEKPFITTSHVKEPADNFTVQWYEPPLSAMVWNGPYLPGDIDADNDIDLDDVNLLIRVLYFGYPMSNIPSPGFYVRGRFSDLDDDNVNINDITQMLGYIYNAEPPPSRKEEPS